MKCPVCSVAFKPRFVRQITCGSDQCIAENKKRNKQVKLDHPSSDTSSIEVREKNKFLLRGSNVCR